MNDEQCDREVFENGTAVLTFAAGSGVTELWVRLVAAESGQRCDWSYFGGRVVVRCIGDADKVRGAALRLKPLLENACADGKKYPYPLSAWRFLEP